MAGTREVCVCVCENIVLAGEAGSSVALISARDSCSSVCGFNVSSTLDNSGLFERFSLCQRNPPRTFGGRPQTRVIFSVVFRLCHHQQVSHLRTFRGVDLKQLVCAFSLRNPWKVDRLLSVVGSTLETRSSSWWRKLAAAKPVKALLPECFALVP